MGSLGESSAARVKHTGGSENVEDLAYHEKGDDETVDVHVIINVKETDHGAKDARHGSVYEHGLEGARRGDSLEARVLGSHVSLFVGSVKSQHDGVELVKGRVAHDVRDVGNFGIGALKCTVCAFQVSTSQKNSAHHKGDDLCDSGQIKGEPVVSALNLWLCDVSVCTALALLIYYHSLRRMAQHHGR